MTPSLPPIGNDLTPHSSTRDLMEELTRQYRSGDSSLANSRLALEEWANQLATGDGSRKEVSLTRSDRIISISELFSGMDRPQAERFLAELFAEVIPHVSNQSRHLQDIARGHTKSGAPIKRTGLLGRLAGAINSMSPAQVVSSTRINSLTWVDDGAYEISSKATIQIEAVGKPVARRIRF